MITKFKIFEKVFNHKDLENMVDLCMKDKTYKPLLLFKTEDMPFIMEYICFKLEDYKFTEDSLIKFFDFAIKNNIKLKEDILLSVVRYTGFNDLAIFLSPYQPKCIDACLVDAARQGKFKLAEALLKAGANPKYKDKSNFTAYDWSCMNNNKDIKELINNYKTEIIKENWEYGHEREFKFDENSTANEGRFRLSPPLSINDYFDKKAFKNSDFIRFKYWKGLKFPEGISAVVGKHNGELHIQALRFNKNIWSEEKAGKWFDENKKHFEFYNLK